MFRFIQALEGRTLFSATSASLAAELTAINTAGAPIKADLTALQAAIKTDLKKISVDLKGSAKTNAALLKTASTAESALAAKLKIDGTALLKATPVATKGVADGNAVIANPAIGAKIQTDITALTKAGAGPLVNISNDIKAQTAIDGDLDALVAANPTLTALATDVAANKSDLSTQITKFVADASTYSNAVGALNTDLTTLLPSTTTNPSLIGDYKGTLKTDAVFLGIGGRTVDLEINVTAQTLPSLSGSITVDGHTAAGTIDVTELTTGSVTFDIDNSGIVGHMVGSVNVKLTKKGFAPGTIITGSGSFTINGSKITGNFSLTKQT